MSRVPMIMVAVGFAAAVAAPQASADPLRCLSVSGDAGSRCLRRYSSGLARPGTQLNRILARARRKAARGCDEASATDLDYPSLGDVLFRIPEACMDFAQDIHDIAFADDPTLLSAEGQACQRRVARQADRLRNTVVKRFGPKCIVPEFAGGFCVRADRDSAVERIRVRASRRILAACGSNFDALGLASGATLQERIDNLLDLVINRARHYTQRVYPPNNLGPTADLGPFPVGVRTFELFDSSRLNVDGSGPRPVTIEVYYPSTQAAIAGSEREVISLFGAAIAPTFTYRDVAMAAGTFPLILFSHGNEGIRFQSLFFGTHMASHGFIVVSPDHHGNTFVDSLDGIVDPFSASNRPRDMSFLIDTLTVFNAEPGNFFEGAIDLSRIGMSGHSFGGYTTFALAGGSFILGTFTDPRITAIFPQAPFTAIFDDAFFASVSVPTLIVGGSIDGITPFTDEQQRPFDNLPAGATVVAVADLIDAGHFTFSDFCEAPSIVLGFLGGASEACEPRHLPWRHAHDIVNYLALNFFDGVLNGNADALGRIDPATVAGIEDLVYQTK